ncbi:MAG: hypothetical protein DLM52_11805 [Chthoniobacterales bacterium]|nr:MAG: hypothetical protein DLM52_11805 [Chthoniobacterales bacterium]
MNGFWRALEQPEYVHTLINPLPIYGLALGIVAFIVALLLRNRAAQIPALVVIFIAAASAWPVTYFGDRAYDRVLSMSDEAGSAWLAAHEHRADQFVWCYYALALVALLALIVPRKFPRAKTPLTVLTLLLAIVSLGAGCYIAYAGGRIRHREFRTEPPPPKPAERD